MLSLQEWQWQMKKPFTIKLVLLMILSLNLPLFAGEIGLGLNLGLTRGTGNSGSSISSLNLSMEKYKAANTGTKTEQINDPFSPVFGVNARYSFKLLLFRMGMYYTENLFFSPGGKITPSGGTSNKIELAAWEASFPVSVCVNIKAGDRMRFYTGIGLSVSLIHMEISQSSPSGIAGLPASKKEEWDTTTGGAHFILGVETPVSTDLSISAEWLICRGSQTEESNTKTEENLSLTENIFLFGINYYIRI